MTVDEAEDRMTAAYRAAFAVFMSRVRETVFVSPGQLDWSAWPTYLWPQLVQEIVIPQLWDIIVETMVNDGVPEDAAAAAAATIVTELALPDDPHIPQRVLEELQEPGAGVSVVPPGEAVNSQAEIWVPMLLAAGLAVAVVGFNSAVFTSAMWVFQSAGAPVVLVWHSRHDESTRPTHLAANGQRARMGQPFIVGGFALRFPHDPLGPPQEVYGCRCWLSFGDA